MIDNIIGDLLDRKSINDNIMENADYKPSAYVNYLDGDVKTQYAQSKNISIKASQKKMNVKGSLHCYYNAQQGKEAKNYNDYSFSMLIETIQMFEEDFKIQAKHVELVNLEAGFNLQINIDPSAFIFNSVFLYKYQYPNISRNTNKMGMIKFIQEDLTTKIYNKSKQYSLIHEYILRIENVYRKDIFRKLGIVYLSDLTKKDCHMKIYQDFLSRFDKNLIIMDSWRGSRETVSLKDRFYLTQYSNPFFWMDIKGTGIYPGINDYKNDFNERIIRNGLNSKKEYLRNLIIEKSSSLLDS